MELVRGRAANGAGVGVYGTEAQAQTGEDTLVGAVHVPVLGIQAIGVDMEAVGVLHQEFARAHHAEARADLVAELGLDLVDGQRQLLVGLQLIAGEVGDHFLVGRAVAELAVLAIGDLQQLAAEFLPTAGFLPQLLRLHRGHQHLDGAGGVHFLADDVLDPAQHLQAQRRPGVDAGGQLADHAGAQHQLMAGDLGVGGDFLGGAEVELGQAHRGVINRGKGRRLYRSSG